MQVAQNPMNTVDCRSMVRQVMGRAAAMVFAFTAFSPIPGQAESAIWRNDWFVPAYPSLFGYTGDLAGRSTGTPVPIVFSSNGDVLLRTPAASQLDDEFIRIGANGAVQWHANLG